MNYKAQEAELWLEFSTCTRQNTFSLILTDFRITYTKITGTIREIVLAPEEAVSPTKTSAIKNHEIPRD